MNTAWKLASLEWMKVRRYKAFWIMVCLFLVGFYGIVNIIFAFNYGSDTAQIANLLFADLFRYPKIGSMTAFLGSFVLILLGITLITQVTNEFSFRTHRQHIIDGLSRAQFINAKWYSIIALALFATLGHILITAIFALVGDGGAFANFLLSLKYSFYFMLNSFSWLSVALLMGILVKRSGLAISIFIIYTLFVENLLSFFIKKLFKSNIGEFLPINIADNLCPNILMPITTGGEKISDSVAVVVCCIYIAGFYLASRKLMERMDLK